ncbi:UNVERIFIED_ORG: hypothetical protein DFO49_5054 [Herbaspirillum seropedicae]
MSLEIQDHISVAEKLGQLGVRFPNGLAILPVNIAAANEIQDLRQFVESDTVKALWRINDIKFVEIFDENQEPPYLQQYGFEWFGPTLFVTAGLLAQDPNVLSVTLGLITNYLYDLFKGAKGGTASLNVVFQESDGACKEIRYNGPCDGLSQIAEIVREMGKKDGTV